MRLSIGQAWSETKEVLRRDGSLIAVVALALLVIPGTLVGLAAPATAASAQQGASWTGALALLSGLIGLAGQIAISRIALGPPLTVGQAVGTGFRRLPAFFLSALLWISPFVLGTAAVLAASGADFTNPSAPLPQANPASGLVIFALMIIFLVVAVHMLFTTPAAAGDSSLGPIGLIKRSWSLSRGKGLKLFGLLLLVILAAIVLVVGLGSALASVFLLVLGDPAPFSLSALFIALVQQLLNAVISVALAVLIARCYAQLTGERETGASVPHAGQH
jgi:hypothetical protein